MDDEEYESEKKTYTIAVYPGPADGKKHPMILVVHGNVGLRAPFGDQIHGLAKDLAAKGYVTAVPRYYVTDPVKATDDNAIPHVPTLTDAIAYIAKRPDADAGRIGLVGFSLGAATAMTYIASNPAGKIQVLVDFFGPINSTIEAGAGRFPPTAIFHNKDDAVVVPAVSSYPLNTLLASVTHALVTYEEDNSILGNHPFVQDGPADTDSRAKAKEWIIRHLPPGGK